MVKKEKNKNKNRSKIDMNFLEAIKFYFSSFRKFIGRRVYIVFILSAAVAFAESLGIALLLPLIEAADTGVSSSEKSEATQYMMKFMNAIGIGESMTGILLFLGVVFIGKGFLSFAEGGYLAYLKSRLMMEIKGKIFNSYSTMDYGYYSRENTGHFINIINSQITQFITAFSNFKSFLSTIIMTMAYFIVAFLMAWEFALMAAVVGVVLLFLFRRLNAFVRDLSIKAAIEESTLNKFLVQTLQSFKYLVSTGQMGYLRKGVFGSIKKLAGYQYKRGLAGSFTSAIKEPVSVLFLLFIIAVQITLFDAPIAPIFVALILFHRGMQQVVNIQSQWQKTLNTVGSLEMVVNEFDTVSSVQEHNGVKKISELKKEIRFDDVNFTYNSEDGNVLTGINIVIPINKTVAIVGESGAGKSTLVDMITLMLRPDKGEVCVDGVPGSEIERGSWRKQIGYVSQETVVFDDTIANNICLWKGDYENDPEVQHKIREASEKAYALGFIEELPDGFNTVVGDRGVRLSGGQRQRLFIARELYKNPNLLILDEATSALDSESESFIQKSIDNLKGSVTVVIIAHRLSTIKNADQIYVLDEGKVIEYGSYDELTLVSNGRFREMVEMQKL